MANNKQLMALSADELIAMGAQVGLTFHTGMKKSHMVQQLSASVASGWMDVNAGLMAGVPEEDFDVSFGDSSMISDAAHIAQMVAGAGLTETFHAAMNGPSHHVEAVHSYMQQLGVSADDVWMHMPKANPNIPAGHWGTLNNYMRDTLGGHQDIMPEIPGHYSGNIMDEYSTVSGDIAKSYGYLAHMYVDREQYTDHNSYARDIFRVAKRLEQQLPESFKEVGYAAATNVGRANAPHISYMDALPQLGSPNIVAGISHARAPLNASGLPMGSMGSGINPSYSLAASLTGTPGWSEASKAIHASVAETVKSAAQVYSGKTGMNASRHITSERDMLMDSASRYADIEDVRSGYANLIHELGDTPSYSGTNIRAILENNYDRMEAEAMAAPSGVADPSLRLPTVAEVGRNFTADFGPATFSNAAVERREAKRIADLDASYANFRDVSDYGVGRSGGAGPQYHAALQQGTPEWLAFREVYDITGSTVGSYLGHNRYTSPIKEMSDKLGFGGPRSQNADMARGHELEPIARARVAQQYGFDIGEVGAITNPAFPRMMYSPDGLIGDDALWEHKAPRKFFDLESHQDYIDQVQLGMQLSGRSRTLFSQTVGNETRSQWIEKDPEWFERNQDKLMSTLGRMDAAREFQASNPHLATDELKAGVRQTMTGEGIWGFQTQKSGSDYYTGGRRGMSRFSASAGTSSDPFIRSQSSFEEVDDNGYRPNFTMPAQNFPAVVPGSGNSDTGGDLMAQSVKQGILAAQEENRNRRGATGAAVEEDADFDDLGNPRGWSRRRIDDAFGGSGGNGGGNGGGRGPGSYYGDYGMFGGSIASGIAGGSIHSMTSGAMNALMMTPWGRIAGLGIGAIQIGNEAAEGLNDFVGNALDAGMTNPNAYSAMSQGMEMLGANSQQAARLNQTTHSAYNTLLNGDPSGAIRLVQGTRGLITIGDIRAAQGDPVALAGVIQQRGRERGWSQARVAGAMEMAGLDGMARSYDRTEYTQGQAESMVGAAQAVNTSDGTAQLEQLQQERARLLPSYNVPQTAIQYGGPAFAAMSNAAGNVRIMGTTSMDAIHQFIAGAESGNNPLARSNTSTAFGSMQTLAGTRRDPGFGVLPAQDDSPEEAARVGRDYYDAMFKRYGDHDKAMAAYTDGPGTVDAAIKSQGENWLSVMPAQAKARVEKFHKWQQEGSAMNQGADMFTRNGTSYGQSPTVVNVNINAKVNSQQASASVSTPNGQSVTQQINMGNGATQRR